MIKVYTGPMFSGKSSALLTDYNLIEDKENIVCFKPSKDTRDKTKIRARKINTEVEAIVINKFDQIKEHITDNTKYIFIDEVQFITGDFNLLTRLSIEKDITIVIAGLSKTNNQRPFGSMPYILAIADEITILKANCECGNEAIYTYCKEKKDNDILIGSKQYKPLCRECLLKHKRGEVNEI